MSKLMDRLQLQLETEYKQDAEDCIIIYNKLTELDNGSVWDSKWRFLVNTIYKGFPSDDRRFKPTDIGNIFLQGLKNK